MRISTSVSTTTRGLVLVLLSTFSFLPEIRAISYTSVSLPNLDLSQLGRVALIGDFDSASLYSYIGQTESTTSANGSQSILGRYPNGAFAALESSDATIGSMCNFLRSDGSLDGVLVGGNFTSLGGQSAQGMAMYQPGNGTVRPLPGLTGQVNTVFCDTARQTAYVGGSFTGSNQTNAITWTGQWETLPFAGFNGPVSSIAQLPNGNIVFGGTFTGTGNLSTPSAQYEQVVNVGGANITASSSTTLEGYSDPRNIICKTSNQTGAGNEWLLADATAGSFGASFGFGFIPTRLRLYNSQSEDFATKTWRFVDTATGGIMNFTFFGANGLESCTAECPLANNASAQDFYFVNDVGMNAFTLQISGWYGSGGGLGGLELFRNDIYVSAIESFNEPSCDDVSTTAASVTTTGSWTVTPSGSANSNFLSAVLSHGTTSDTTASVVFYPNIKQSGNYSVTLYTPGCISDGTCSTRGLVNVTSNLGTPTSVRPVSTQLYQTNNYQKYDQIYFGYIDATNSSFRPSVTLTPASGQSGPLTVVAQSIRFDLIASAGTLNGLYEFNPNGSTVNSEFSTSTIDTAGTSLYLGAQVYALEVIGNTTYVAGVFSSSSVTNIMGIANGNVTVLSSGGLNGPVQGLYANSSLLYAVGNFSNLADGSLTGLNNIAAYSTTSGSWAAVGAGVNGIVYDTTPLSVNISDASVDCLAFSGYFDQVNAFGAYPAFEVGNIAVWVPSRSEWLHNIDAGSIALSGRLTAQVNVPGTGQLFAGTVTSYDISSDGVVELSTTSPLELEELPLTIATSSSSSTTASRKRAVSSSDAQGVLAATYYDNNGSNLTILGGEFSTTASDDSTITNLAIVNATDSNTITGLATSTSSGSDDITALATEGDLLITGSSAGISIYNLTTSSLMATQPAALSASTTSALSQVVTINAILAQPNTSVVFVAGYFATAGTTACPALCLYNTTSNAWSSPTANTSAGSGISDSSKITSMQWTTATRLVLAGNLTINGSQTTLASYSTINQTFSPMIGAGSTANVPGAITAFTATDHNHTAFFVAGASTTDSSAFLTHINTTTGVWTSIPTSLGLLPASSINSLQLLALSTTTTATSLLPANTILLLTGALQLSTTSFTGNVSAALFDSSAFIPFLLTSRSDGSAGIVRALVVQNPSALPNSPDLSAAAAASSTSSPSSGTGSGGSGSSNGKNDLAIGYVILIALAISLALVFLLVLAGILLETLRRRREGYQRANERYVPYEDASGGAAVVGGAAGVVEREGEKVNGNGTEKGKAGKSVEGASSSPWSSEDDRTVTGSGGEREDIMQRVPPGDLFGRLAKRQ